MQMQKQQIGKKAYIYKARNEASKGFEASWMARRHACHLQECDQIRMEERVKANC